MGTINNQRLSTGDNRNFESGFPLFPANTSLANPRTPLPIGAGYGPRVTHNIVDVQCPLAWFMLVINVNAQVIAGVFFGFQVGYNVQGVTRNDGTASLTFSNEFMQGGIGFGVGATANLTIRLDESVLDFTIQNGFTGSWQTLLNITVSASFDLLELAINLLGSVLGQGTLQSLSEIKQVASNGAIWGLYAANATSGLSSGTSLVIRPRANFSINLLEAIPKFGPLIEKAGKIGFKLSVGPTVVLLFPVTLSIVRLTTEDGNYDFSNTSGRTFNFAGGPTGTLAPTVSSVNITHSHTVGIELHVELRASASFLKMISISGAIRIPLNIGDRRATGPFFTQLSNGQNLAQHVELPEVVWG